MNKEIRKIESPLTVDEESRTVEGYAVVFESESENLGFFETIKRGAITEELIAQSDVFARFNHDENKVLARSKNGSGSLTLILDDRGLQYRFEAPKTALGDELLEYLKRGDITASSFCFAIDPEDASAENGRIDLVSYIVPSTTSLDYMTWHRYFSQHIALHHALIASLK